MAMTSAVAVSDSLVARKPMTVGELRNSPGASKYSAVCALCLIGCNAAQEFNSCPCCQPRGDCDKQCPNFG
ncbi:predicted protein [Plenodomus lingam JN3]|uniref:Predicted protein n=1 Tax=Leptosphaeria maculans (strain JN3 / isolate v23.1.3 / race Av1-4-5-6-7-8) TaxID=985895 RepID=E5AB39_LEPMJ|nr:predicted protein [Plenodomus lingam JN3]CBY00880.1 predicted protein [Plenodomus lingam JN3]